MKIVTLILTDSYIIKKNKDNGNDDKNNAQNINKNKKKYYKK